MELGVKVLKLPEFKIKSALYDNKRIQSAAHELLSAWLKQQSDRQMAYTALQTALRKCDDFRSMAAELEQWDMGTVNESHISPERKLIYYIVAYFNQFFFISSIFNAGKQLQLQQAKFCKQIKQACKSNKNIVKRAGTITFI